MVVLNNLHHYPINKQSVAELKGAKIEVINEVENKDDLMQDLLPHSVLDFMDREEARERLKQ